MSEEKSLEIFDISYNGSGVGRKDGKIVFVPKTLVGEKVTYVDGRVTSSFTVGSLRSVIEKSEDRVEPKCPYYNICGGCAFLHCNENAEKNMKIQILKKEMKKVEYSGDVEFVENNSRFGYRNKMKFEVKDGKLGYFKVKSREFFEVEMCLIADDEINVALPVVEKFINENDFSKLKNVYFKKVESDLAIILLFEKNAKIKLKKVVGLENLNKYSVFFAYGDILESNETKIENVLGKKIFKKKLDDVEYDVDVSSFNQVNDNMAEKLYEYVASLCKGKRVINAYSGQGLLTYILAKKAAFVYGIEYQKSAHEQAEKLAKKMPEYHMFNICGKVEEEIGEIIFRDPVNTIVLDPSREGCQRVVLEEILKSFAEQIIYISCNFPTLVRDLDVLKDKYKIENIKIFDMFPGCCAMETVVYLKKRD